MRFLPKEEKLYKWLAFIAIALGIFVRLAVYLQNRNLMIDEANVARNIYERGFAALALPLSYEQYAPPLWLWFIKLSTLLFGMGEQALRLVPLISGFASLFLLYHILKTLTSHRSLWYPVLLLAIGYIFIRYSTELKQYMTDACVCLSLLLLALKTDIQHTKLRNFVLIWLACGSIAIWLSMPSVFILSGVGGYYFLICAQHRLYKKMACVAFAALIWFVQFAIYYWFILREQANSAYLQNFHKDYFLSATPTTFKEWDHNINLLGQVLGETAGFTFLAKAMHSIFIIWACIALIKKDKALFSLLVLPLALVLVAAAANQFSMIPRVVLFMMPLLLILIGYTFNEWMHTRYKYLKWPLVAACTICIVNVNALRFFFVPMHTEQLTDALLYAEDKGINSSRQLYLHNGCGAAFIYYTTIHPGKEKWLNIKDAHLLKWDTDYDSLAKNINLPSAIIFTSIYPSELNRIKNTMQKHLKQTYKQEKPGSCALIYAK